MLYIKSYNDDVGNMIRIDMASKERNVEYILDVFKCEDMLYVSRAIKKSTWLITDPQHAHVVNPKHLHSELFPQMNAKAVTKLMLHIRRHLKDEVRVKAFYNYVNKMNPKAALQWLSNCPLKFIESIVAARAKEITFKLLRRFCKKSINILRIYLKYEGCYDFSDIMKDTKYFLKNKKTAVEFLDIIECRKRHYFNIKFNKKYTTVLMKICPEIMKDKFATFHTFIDLTTFVKYIRPDEIRPFLMKTSSSDSCKTWKCFETLTPFLEKLPRGEILDFLSALYEVEYDDSKHSDNKEKSNVESLFYRMEDRKYNRFTCMCRWYRFVPFEIALRDLKKFIFAESAPEERHSILIILLTCASNDPNHLKTVLQYYHDKHINEPYLHKKTFIDCLLSHHYAFRFDDSMWNILNALLYSSEVYIESDNDVQASLSSIIVRAVLHDQPVHEVVEEKFQIDTLRNIKTTLSLDEQDKVFTYLYNLLVKRLNQQSTSSETGMRKAIELLKTMWSLITDWDRVESLHGFVIDKAAELCDINKASSWFQEMRKTRRKRRNKKPNRDYKMRAHHFRKPNPKPYVDIASIYKMPKTYRKRLFEKSLEFNVNEEVLLNALKHDPGLLARYKTETDYLRSNDEISLNRFLSKLRIYWPDSLAMEWIESNTASLRKLSGHRVLVRSILVLLPHNKALDFIKTYTPDENKIQWSEINEIELSIKKHIAKNMHIARPQLSAEVVLWYAKGDYLQFALLSLYSMYYNLRSNDVRRYIDLMLNAPVSLQKHGIRLAFIKYNTNEKIEMAVKCWKKNRNSSIRAILFTSMYKLLCKEKKVMTIKAAWSVLSSFIDDLNEEENKIIYITLGKAREVPLSVVADFYQKGYLFLKSLPEEVGIDFVLEGMLENTEQLVEYLDTEFVEKSLLGSIADVISNHDNRECCNHKLLEILTAYLLCSKDHNTQMQRFNTLMEPVIDICIRKWVKDDTYLLEGFQAFLGHVCSRIPQYVFEQNMTMPVEIVSIIRDGILKGSLCVKENYVMIRRWQITVRYIETLNEIKKSDEQISWESIRTASLRHIASICHDTISEDQRTLFPSVYFLFKETLQTFFNDFKIRDFDLLKVLFEMLRWEDCPSMYLLVLEMIPRGWGKDFEYWERKIKKKIYFHPADEVAMHYFKRFRDKYSADSDDDDDETEESDTCSTCSEEESQDEQDVTYKQDSHNNASLFGYRCNIM